MKSIWGALALGCLITTPAAAQDCPASKCPSGEAKAKIAGPVAPATTTVADDEEKEIRELEKELNKVLLVDETGKIVLREEVKGMLPIPAERVEAMLGTFVELGKDGKIKVKDIEMVRPYLPMIRRFLKQGGLERLKNTRPERREAMKKMMPKAEPPTERPVRPRTEARPPRRTRRPDRPRRSARGEVPPQLERRLARIERSLGRIERMMNQMSKLHRELGRDDRRRLGREHNRDRRGWGRRDRRERRGWNRRDRRRGDRWERDRRDDRRRVPDLRRMFERGNRLFERGRDMDDLRRMFERFRDEFGGGERDFRRMFERFRDEFAPRRDRRNNRDDDDDDDDRGARRNMLERGNVFAKGFGKLAQTIKPEDRALVLKAMRSMLMNANPGDMGKPDKMLDSFRKTMDEDEMQRLMKIFGEFSSTDEGHALQQELSRIGADVEGFMSSAKGEQLGRALKRFQKQLGGDERLNKKIEKLMNHRRGWSRSKRAREGKAEKKDWSGPRNPKAKLY